MFKKTVIVILFAATVFLVYMFMNSTVSNDGRADGGGRFENDIYINEKTGIQVDLSDRWVYYDYSRVKDAPGDAAAYFTEDSALFVAQRPGVTVEFCRADSTFRSLTIENIYEAMQTTMESYRDNGIRCEYKDHGRLSADRDMYYYHLTYSKSDFSGEMITVLFNTADYGMVVFATAENPSDIGVVKDFLLQKVSLISPQSQA